MTTATAPDITVPLLGGRHHFLLRRLHSLTGIIFGGYLIVHLLVNASLVERGSVYQVQVNKIHDLPFLWGVEIALIFLPITYHTLYGIWITLTGVPNNERYGYLKNWFYLTQRISAAIILLFVLFHVLTLKFRVAGGASPLSFDPHNAAFTVHQHMTSHWWVAWLVYPLGITASCFHLANGFWTAGITWGLTVSAAAQRRWGWICLLIFILTELLGLMAVVAAASITPLHVS